MAHIVCEPCVGCKYTDCVEVCPVNCFYEVDDRLYIHPDECIDCGVCVPECPAEAIFPDTDPMAEGRWLELNRKFAEQWPNVLAKGEPPVDADSWNGVLDKFVRFFSEKPGKD